MKPPQVCQFRVPDHTDWWHCGKPVYVADRCQKHALEEARDLAAEVDQLDRELMARRSKLVARIRSLGCGHGHLLTTKGDAP